MNSAQANFNVVRRTFSYGDLIIPMVGRKCTCLMHWMKSVEMHTRCLIKLDLEKEHKRLCHQYKKCKIEEEMQEMYATIQEWWYLNGITSEKNI